MEGLGLPGELDRLLQFCLAASRGGRYRDATELASAFRLWRNRLAVLSPHKRGVSRRSLIAAAPLLLTLAIPVLTSGAPIRLSSGTWTAESTSLVDLALPELANSTDPREIEQRRALLEACATVEALQAPYDSGAELAPSSLRRAACRQAAVQLADLKDLPDSAIDLLDLLSFRVGLAELDSFIETVPLQDGELRFWLGPVSNQELQVLRSQRDQPLARILAKYQGTQLGVDRLDAARNGSLLRTARPDGGERSAE
jgi:hypothetical protein